MLNRNHPAEAPRVAKLGKPLRYHPAPDERDPTGAPMSAEDYAAVVTIARTDNLVHVVVTIDGGNNDFGLGIQVARLVPLVAIGDAAPAGAHCTWF